MKLTNIARGVVIGLVLLVLADWVVANVKRLALPPRAFVATFFVSARYSWQVACEMLSVSSIRGCLLKQPSHLQALPSFGMTAVDVFELVDLVDLGAHGNVGHPLEDHFDDHWHAVLVCHTRASTNAPSSFSGSVTRKLLQPRPCTTA